MKYKFSLEASDYLTHQLFIVSTSKPAIGRKRRSWAITTGIILLSALLFYKSSNAFMTYYFIGAGVLCLIFFPFYYRWRFRKHYHKHIKENFSKSFGKEVTIEIQDEHIFAQDESGSESKISHASIESLHELPEHFLIKLDNGHALILPKNKITEVQHLRTDFVELGRKINKDLKDYTKWKW